MTQFSTQKDLIRGAAPADFQFLGTVEPFAVFPAQELAELADLVRVETYRRDEMIFRVSDLSDAVFVVRAGQVAVYTDTIGEPVQLNAKVNPGEMFGEVGVLERSRRTVSARATTETEVLRLEASALSKLGQASQKFGARLAQAALLRYMADSVSNVELGQRREVRIRIDKPVLIRASDNEALPARLANLSRGGICLSGMPDSWDLADTAAISLLLDEETELLRANARIAWRNGSLVGLAFCGESPSHGARVDAALDVLLTG